MQFRKHVGTVVIAVVAGAIGAGAPAIAHGVERVLFAANADKVDGKHAVGAGATVPVRAGKLVATNPTTGRLPNNIIAMAPNAGHLDGLDSSDFVLTDRIYTATVTNVLGPNDAATPHANCDPGDVVFGGTVYGQGLVFNSESRFMVPGTFGSNQGWRADVTATADMGNHAVTVNAICFRQS